MQETGVRSLIWEDPKRHGATKPVCASSVAQSYPTLCNHMDRSPPGSSGHGLSQATMLGWVAISSPRGSCQPRDGTPISCSLCTGGRAPYHWATWEAQPSPRATSPEPVPASPGAVTTEPACPRAGAPQHRSPSRWEASAPRLEGGPALQS